MAALSVALTSALALLNDDAQTIWTNTNLINKAQDVHRELQSKLWDAGSPVVRKESTPIPITAGANPTVTPPTDMLTPFSVIEYDTATGSRSTAVPMTESTFLPYGKPLQNNLVYWSWQAETFSLLGANTNRTIIIFYRRLITIPQATSDPIGIIFGEQFMGARIAAIAHGSIGNEEEAVYCAGLAEEYFQVVLNAQRGKQVPSQKQ